MTYPAPLLRILVPALLTVFFGAASSAGAVVEKEDLAEGKFAYIKLDQNRTSLTSTWGLFAQAMPNWKEKAKKAHYSFKKGVNGRKCNTNDCHPGFKDQFVETLKSLPEGAARDKAKETRNGLARCEDCHAYETIYAKTNACRLHFQLKDRVQCISCHTEGSKVLIPVGKQKTIALRDHDIRADWPAHKLTKEEKKISCDTNCHAAQNSFSVASICSDCHSKGKLELASYTSPNLLIHSKAHDSPIPDYIRLFYKILISSFAIFAGLFILLDMIRSRKEGSQ